MQNVMKSVWRWCVKQAWKLARIAGGYVLIALLLMVAGMALMSWWTADDRAQVEAERSALQMQVEAEKPSLQAQVDEMRERLDLMKKKVEKAEAATPAEEPLKAVSVGNPWGQQAVPAPNRADMKPRSPSKPSRAQLEKEKMEIERELRENGKRQRSRRKVKVYGGSSSLAPVQTFASQPVLASAAVGFRPYRNRIPESDAVMYCGELPPGYAAEDVIHVRENDGWLMFTLDGKMPTIPMNGEEWKLVNLGSSSIMLPLVRPGRNCYTVPEVRGHRKMTIMMFGGSESSDRGMRLKRVRQLGDGSSELRITKFMVNSSGGATRGRVFNNALRWLRDFANPALRNY